MAIRKQHSRQSKRYLIEKIDGVQYYIEPDTYISKSVIYQTRNKIKSKKLDLPLNLLQSKKTILVVCLGKGKYKFSTI
jgi:hypothetical protein